jgi:hypothetical protein
MELKNDQESYEALDQCITGYYRSKGQPCLSYGAGKIKTSKIDGKIYENDYVQTYFVARKNFIQYSIPIDRCNFFAGLLLGVGPHFVPLGWLLSEALENELSMESTTDAVLHNLVMLDDYFYAQPAR